MQDYLCVRLIPPMNLTCYGLAASKIEKEGCHMWVMRCLAFTGKNNTVK